MVFGRGITDDSTFLKRGFSSISELMEGDGLQFLRERVFLPDTSSISFSKALNRSVTGSVNELVMFAQFVLTEEETRQNTMPRAKPLKR